MLKKTLSFILCALLIFSFAGCASNSSEGGEQSEQAAAAKDADGGLYHLKVAYSPSLCQAPLHIAVEKGFFEAEGIDAENIQVEASHVMEAVGAGQVDVGFGLIGKFLLPIENGLNIRFTAGIHTGCIKILALPDSGITSVSDLRGKKIAVTGLAGAETIVTKRALSNEGISFDEQSPEVEFLVFASSDMGQALQNGAADVIALADPNASQYEDEYGLTVLLDTAASEGFKDEYCCGAFVTEDLAVNHPEVAAAFTRAVLKAAVWVNEHPEEAAQIQIDKDYVAGDAEFNAKVLRSYNYIPSVQGGYDAIQLSVAQLTDIGILKEGTVAKDFADGAYIFFDDVPDTYSPEEIELSASAETSDKSVSAASLSYTDGETEYDGLFGEDCCTPKDNNDCCKQETSTETLYT
ncbi:MAG: ABC transporter substrate-binding protein [Clostridia bacterium]|nr:ABC transporter substrate-binding protein [Clostridia bacterium]MBQ4248703.1 ABC transporter substrate-binding protein [Clostridia bacterium]